eukprot:scaffold3021_cov182-Skeletonema_dohrnii-CCMP3373.AAC.5
MDPTIRNWHRLYPVQRGSFSAATPESGGQQLPSGTVRNACIAPSPADCRGVLTFSKEHRRIPAGAKNNDILRVLRRIQTTSKLAHKLQHGKACGAAGNRRLCIPINALLSQPLASESSTATDPDLSFKRSANGVKFESLKTLNPGLWLKSDVINSFAMNIIRPLVRNRRVHFFSTYFFSRLLDTGPHGTQTPSYKFDEVERWGDRLSNGILGVKELIIPINHRNVHWLCLKGSMANKSIMLWDSSGVKESNQLYLNTMLRYLKDKFRATSPQEDADDWIAMDNFRRLCKLPTTIQWIRLRSVYYR